MNRNGARREYDLYLFSPHWRSLTARIKLARGNKCERCGAPERLDTHHLGGRELEKESAQECQKTEGLAI
jgi:hypothetical protein